MEETAMFGAGCFWGVEAAFRKLNGILETKVGYAGGKIVNPTYTQVCSHTTGHAEVVQLKFDSEKITYEDLLKLFWKIQTPIIPRGQVFDANSQYRSGIFYYSNEQKQQAIKSKERIQKSGFYEGEIITQIVPATTFYLAEDYHQCYLEKLAK
jgi:peptide-methionine (S)-S-oxide reductase